MAKCLSLLFAVCGSIQIQWFAIMSKTHCAMLIIALFVVKLLLNSMKAIQLCIISHKWVIVNKSVRDNNIKVLILANIYHTYYAI